MSRKILISFYAFLIAAPLLGQQAPQAKSPEEAEALQALFAARDPDTRIEVAKKILKNFKNTEFKDAVLYYATVSYEEKNDIVNMQIYGERALEVNPDHVPTLVALAYGISLRTRQFDLDKVDKTRSERGLRQARHEAYSDDAEAQPADTRRPVAPHQERTCSHRPTRVSVLLPCSGRIMLGRKSRFGAH